VPVKVGCCGWAVKGGMEAYFREFKLIELQTTFYRLPNVSTAEGWRARAPEDFEFTMKSWQAVTHPPSSPTWRRAGLKPPPERAERYGHLKPTEENFEAWDRTMEVARALRARIIVVQLPPSFEASDENLRNMRDFFSSIDRRGVLIAVEFRHGSWTAEVAARACLENGLVHVVDPFKARPAVEDQQVVYYRLHGLGPRMYVYDYSDEELLRLHREWVKPHAERGAEVYVLFNNTAMAEDARRFREIASSLP